MFNKEGRGEKAAERGKVNINQSLYCGNRYENREFNKDLGFQICSSNPEGMRRMEN